MQFKPFVVVILLFVAQSIVAQSIVAQSPGSEEYGPSSEDYPNPSIPEVPSSGCMSIFSLFPVMFFDVFGGITGTSDSVSFILWPIVSKADRIIFS